jgi:hypothetical protein
MTVLKINQGHEGHGLGALLNGLGALTVKRFPYMHFLLQVPFFNKRALP